MSVDRVKIHPTLGLLVRTDGSVFIPDTKFSHGHMTYGSKSQTGYMFLSRGNKTYLIHRIVAETFIPNPDNLPQVDHINRDKTDNRVENLRWVSRSTNQRNTDKSDNTYSRLGIHTYDDPQEYNKRNCKDWYDRNKLGISEFKKTAEYKDKENARRRAYYAEHKTEMQEKLREYRRRKNNG